jgi:hypothetical protein
MIGVALLIAAFVLIVVVTNHHGSTIKCPAHPTSAQLEHEAASCPDAIAAMEAETKRSWTNPTPAEQKEVKESESEAKSIERQNEGEVEAKESEKYAAAKSKEETEAGERYLREVAEKRHE